MRTLGAQGSGRRESEGFLESRRRVGQGRVKPLRSAGEQESVALQELAKTLAEKLSQEN